MTIYAFTELHNNFPAFINLSEQPDGVIKVSVRTRGNHGKDYATITLTALQAEELAESIYKNNYKGEAKDALAPAALSADQAWDVLAKELGVDVISWDGKRAITIETPVEAGEVARALLAAAGSSQGQDATLFRWLGENPSWSVRWRIHQKTGARQWRMIDDGEPWGQWGERSDVISAACKAYPTEGK